MHFALEPGCVFLNHGSFGAATHAVLAAQSAWRARMEAQPVRLLVRELECLLDRVRERLGAFVGADPLDLVFVPNATAAVNSVLGSLPLRPGDGVLVTNHEYNACTNVLEHACARAGAMVQRASFPFPLRSAEQVLEALEAAITPATRWALLDHVTSPTGLVLPLERMVALLRARGIEALVDGAHAPGMLALSLEKIGAGFYTGNCHKWMMAPKGAAFLWVRRDLQPLVRPAMLSHGANSPRTDRSRFLVEFDWTGTMDPTAVLCIPDAIAMGEVLLPGGWPALREHNRALALQGRAALLEALGTPAPAPDEMVGSMVSVVLPDGEATWASPLYGDALQEALWTRYGVEVPVIPWPAPPGRLLRISAQVYNHHDEYAFLARALGELLA